MAIAVVLLTAATVLVDASLSRAHSIDAPATFSRWYGSTPLPDQNLVRTPSAWKVPLNPTSESTWLSLLPTWSRMRETAINGSVVPFVDEIVTVRCLGGWDARYGDGNETDDIIDMNYNFRWPLLDERIDPWVFGANKSILFVLDNVPYVFTDGHPVLGPFGQDAPPSNYTKFHWFVKEVTQHLVDRYGASYVANRFRFRVGTEPDGPRYGNITQYYHSYAAAATAVKAVSPESPVGAGNWLHQSRDYNTSQAFEFEFYALARINDIPVDFIAQSDYVQGLHTDGRRYPCFIRDGAEAMQNYAAIYGTPAMPLQVHEFAPLYNVDRHTSVEPDSFGVSFYIACWATALSSGVDRIFHWGTAHEAGGAHGEQLWTGYGWAMGMAEMLVGLPVANISRPASCERGVYSLSAPSATLATAFDPGRYAEFNVTFTVPHAVTTVYRIDNTTSPFDAMLADAVAQGFTKNDDALPYGIGNLLNPAGRAWLRQPEVWSRFMAMQRATFTPESVEWQAGDSVTLPQFTSLLMLE